MAMPESAREWVLERYRDDEFTGTPESHWRLATAFCAMLSKASGTRASGTRSQIFIVPASHIAESYDGTARIGVCYEGHTELAEAIQLGHPRFDDLYRILASHDCYLGAYNHWSAIVQD